MVRYFKFFFEGLGEMRGRDKVVEACGGTREGAEMKARARLRDATRRDSSMWRTRRVEFLKQEEGGR
jgi:hypothetical protein